MRSKLSNWPGPLQAITVALKHQTGRYFLILSRDDSDESAPDPPPVLIGTKQCKQCDSRKHRGYHGGFSSHMFPCSEVEVPSSLLHLLHFLRLLHIESVVKEK